FLSQNNENYCLAHSPSWPFNILRPWSNSDIRYSRVSLQAFGLPGRFIIRLSSLITEVALDNIALLVIVILYARIASAIPGTNFVATLIVASGVTSLLLKPVPPVVSIKSSFLLSEKSINFSSICSFSSGIISQTSTLHSFFSNISLLTLPLKSSLSPLLPLSETVIIPTLNILVLLWKCIFNMLYSIFFA